MARWPLGVLLAVPAALPAQSQEPAVLYKTVCATCHGPEGEGKRELFAPSISGLPAWYVEFQLAKFREGHRGLPPDQTGAVMRAIAISLSVESIPPLARYIASLEPHPTEGEPPEDVARVAALYYESCAPCHRFNGHGERVFKSAPITVLPVWYIEDSLLKFREGIRGNHPDDEQGAKMREITAHLSDEIIADLASYLTVLAETYPPGERRQRIRRRRREPVQTESPFSATP